MDTGLQNEKFLTNKKEMKTLVLSWEEKLEVERSEKGYWQKDSLRGGRRRSQNFMDLCSKFDELSREGETEAEVKKTTVGGRNQSKDPSIFEGMRESSISKLQPQQYSTTFSSLRANWGSGKQKPVLKQQVLSFRNNGLSLAKPSANRKRGRGGDKGSGAKKARLNGMNSDELVV